MRRWVKAPRPEPCDNALPVGLGDVPQTVADVSRLEAAVGFKPATPIEAGVANFVQWYRAYYKV